MEIRTHELEATQVKYLEVTRGVARIRSTFNLSREIQTQARLYDEERGALSGAKIIKILVDFAGKVEGSAKDIQTLVSNIPNLFQQNPERVRTSAGTLNSNRRRRALRISSSDREGEFSEVPPNMTWDHVIQYVENPNVPVDLETSFALSNEPEVDAVLEFGLKVNLDMVFSNPNLALKTKEGEDLEEEDVQEAAEPIEKGDPVQGEKDPVETRSVNEESTLSGQSKLPI